MISLKAIFILVCFRCYLSCVLRREKQPSKPTMQQLSKKIEGKPMDAVVENQSEPPPTNNPQLFSNENASIEENADDDNEENESPPEDNKKNIVHQHLTLSKGQYVSGVRQIYLDEKDQSIPIGKDGYKIVQEFMKEIDIPVLPPNKKKINNMNMNGMPTVAQPNEDNEDMETDLNNAKEGSPSLKEQKLLKIE